MWADDFFSSSDLQTDQDLNDEAKHQANITEDRLFTLEDFTYNNSGVANRIFHHLSEIEFTGITVIAFLHIAQDIFGPVLYSILQDKSLLNFTWTLLITVTHCRVLYHSVKMV